MGNHSIIFFNKWMTVIDRLCTEMVNGLHLQGFPAPAWCPRALYKGLSFTHSHTHTFTHTFPLHKCKFFPNFDSLLQIKHFKLWMELLQRCGVAVVLEKMPICQISFGPPSLRTSHFAASVFTRLLSRTASGNQPEKKRSSGLFFEDETQLWISPHVDSFSSLLFFLFFCCRCSLHALVYFSTAVFPRQLLH